MVVIFILIYFEWRDTGNQQLFPVTAKSRARTTDFFWSVYFFSFMAYGCKPCHVSNVPVTPLMKSQSRNVWRGGLESLLLKTLSKVWKRDPDPAFPLRQSRIPNFPQLYLEYPSLSPIPHPVPKIWRKPLPNFLSNPVFLRKFAFSRISHCIWSVRDTENTLDLPHSH